ncbi:MAG: methionine adenosyltransferase [Elusimicrobia bacterium GWC2_51_8]|nr:MAG: methionine adenosyltransferase [Elusimicrobia bacterium GWA2_51_34]OGR58132.1 MAG: methionine adenosyltransferase [Elusimicrobia bacterium GWC2_51_8]OGR84412.1 MAG: methionine adenosyltransferase [Elusimicrobia bacterium GWF2_52_66]HAF95103.1 methionine adenosyltransferase [Elusimicrobiota bacterium]HCE98622.1 methionine adenosyltransferase [Elusimicrobiota bacterium]
MDFKRKRLVSSESVTEGHPDKVCDQISDAVLDEIMKKDPAGRVACETFITRGLVVVGGEITTKTYIDVDTLARQVIKDIGYTHAKYGFNYETCAVVNVIGRQSPDISQGVDTGGAGDQGLMVGYACDETPEFMPMPLVLAHRLTMRLAEVRKKGILDYLGPDGKSQVTVEYLDGRPGRIETVVLSSQHTGDILDKTGMHITESAKREIIETVALPALDKKLLTKDTRFLINPTGKFLIGGPQSDTGVTGRKIIVDTYGGVAPHGGGAFSGKDSTKVDRSAAYMARYVAKNIVAAGLARECTLQVAYAIGVAEPVGLYVDTRGSGVIADDKLSKLVLDSFDFTPRGMIKNLKLREPIFRKTASYGHFGRMDAKFEWEKLNAVDMLKKKALGGLKVRAAVRV